MTALPSEITWFAVSTVPAPVTIDDDSGFERLRELEGETGSSGLRDETPASRKYLPWAT